MNLLLLTTTYFPETKSAAFMLKALAEEFKIKGNKKSIVYLPDIDSWNNFEDKLHILIKENDLLFISKREE